MYCRGEGSNSVTALCAELLAQYQQAAAYLNGLIQGPPSPPPGATPEQIRARAQARLARLRRFLEFLGRPHESYPTVHVTGTSGKGSTATFIASILTAAGYHVGLHTSPYLQVETEKLQLDRALLPADRFARYVAELDQAIQRWNARGEERLTYGECWTALTFLAFAEERVDIAVIEVGVGGRFDLTNVIMPEVAVITSVGLDHVRTLGPTIRDIAWHKAGILKPGRPGVTTVTDPELLEIIRREAETVGAPLDIVQPEHDYALLRCDATGTWLLDYRRKTVFQLGLLGKFQIPNAAAALAAVEKLGHLPRGPITTDVVRRGLAEARIPGRFEIVQTSPTVILDGAHNPDKMRGLLESLACLPQPSRRILVFGVLEGHDALTMARLLAPHITMAIVTTPQALERPAADPAALADCFADAQVPVQIVPLPQDAIAQALALAAPDDQIIVTGSLYLVGQVRERWYPHEAMICAATPWPAPAVTQAPCS